MEELISVITAATASGASNEQKEAGVAACRTILTALDTEPGKPLAHGTATPVQSTPRVSIDQVLELMIARLSMLAKERENNQPALAPATLPPTTAVATTSAPGFRVPFVAGRATKAGPRAASMRVTPSEKLPVPRGARRQP